MMIVPLPVLTTLTTPPLPAPPPEPPSAPPMAYSAEAPAEAEPLDTTAAADRVGADAEGDRRRW